MFFTEWERNHHFLCTRGQHFLCTDWPQSLQNSLLHQTADLCYIWYPQCQRQGLADVSAEEQHQQVTGGNFWKILLRELWKVTWVGSVRVVPGPDLFMDSSGHTSWEAWLVGKEQECDIACGFSTTPLCHSIWGHYGQRPTLVLSHVQACWRSHSSEGLGHVTSVLVSFPSTVLSQWYQNREATFSYLLTTIR